MDEAFDLAVSPPRPTAETPSPGMTVNVGGLRVRTTSEGGSSVEAQAARTTPKTKLHVVEYAFKKAVGGGMAGAIAMVLNVFLLMWLRTTVTYQYKTGMSASETFATLYAEGGIGRFYQGIMWALVLAPLARFGETAANEGVAALFADSGFGTTSLTALAAVCAAWWRIMISPIDMVKTEMQVNGEDGLREIMAKIEAYGPLVLYTGSFGICLSSIVAFYPFFLVHNFLQKIIPTGPRFPAHSRNAVIGLCSSIAAVVSSNPIKVLKTVVQTSDVNLGYSGALRVVTATDGVLHGLVLRGLVTRLVADGLSAIVFTVLWKALLARWETQDSARRLSSPRGHSRKASKPHTFDDS